MSYRVALRPEAEEEIAEAATWYEAQQPGLAAEFFKAVVQAVELVSENPRLVSRRRRRRDIRWIYPGAFPYRIIFEISRDCVIVLAVLHAARDDFNWKRRVK